MLRSAALASSVVASTPIVLPFTRLAVASTWRIQVNTARWVSRSISRRVREIVECSGGVSSRVRPRNPRSANESAVRHAMPRSESMPSKYPDQQQAEVRAGRQSPPTHARRVERGTQRFDERVGSGVRRAPDSGADRTGCPSVRGSSFVAIHSSGVRARSLRRPIDMRSSLGRVIDHVDPYFNVSPSAARAKLRE
jgi:hypothetical protein